MKITPREKRRHAAGREKNEAFFLVAATRPTLVMCSVLLFVLQIVIMSSVDSGWRVFDRC